MCMQQGCRNGTNKGLYLDFSQLVLEQVRAGGSHKHGREKLGVWFHLEQRKEQQVNNRAQTGSTHQKLEKRQESMTCGKQLNDAS